MMTLKVSPVFSDLEKAKIESLFDANDKIRQDQAMMALDVTARFGGSMEQAAAAVRAKVFVIVATADHVVTPGPGVCTFAAVEVAHSGK